MKCWFHYTTGAWESAWWKSFHLSCNNCYCSKPRHSLDALRIKQCHRCCYLRASLLESETYRLLPLCTMASSSTHQLRTFSTPNWSTIVWTWLTLSTTCQSFPNCRPFKATTQLRNLYCFIQKFFLFSNSQKSFSSVFSDCVGVSCRCCCIHCFSVKITNLQNSPKNTSVGCYAIKGCSSSFLWSFLKASEGAEMTLQ